MTGSGDDFLTLSTFILRFNIIHVCTLFSEFQFAYNNNKTQLKVEELKKITFRYPNYFLDVCDCSVFGFVNIHKTGAFVGSYQFLCFWCENDHFIIDRN
jgi:hypothetical protein